MTIGIFGGSFDPIHKGHTSLARYALRHAGLDAVWLMVAARNPLKPSGPVATDEERLAMARIAVEGIPGVEASDFEFALPRPSYTWLTLTELKKAWPEHDFRLIIGGDNWADFGKWSHPEVILKDFGVIVYPRPVEALPSPPPNVFILEGAPQMPVSSTQIRSMLSSAANPDARKGALGDLLNPEVAAYIERHHIYS